MQDSFVSYVSFENAIERLPEEMKLEAYEMVIEYGLNGKEYDGDNYVVAALFEAFRDLIKD